MELHKAAKNVINVINSIVVGLNVNVNCQRSFLLSQSESLHVAGVAVKLTHTSFTRVTSCH